MTADPMTSRQGRDVVTLEAYRDRIGAAPTASDWMLVDQTMITEFARLTGDNALIHVNPEAAAKSRFGGAIAHGLLVLSLVPQMMRSATPLIRNTRMGANYGYDKLRFPAPMRAGARARGWFTLKDIENRASGFHVLHYGVKVEAEGQTKPVISATWLIARWMDRNSGGA